jgi:4'-phosphopantetheinyl transferase EntD
VNGSRAADEALGASLFGGLPVLVACVGSPSGGTTVDLLPEEAACVARSSPNRRREFAAGRAAARAALGRLGVPSGPIGVAEHRMPRWPAGVVGSIAHGGGIAVAAVALARTIASVGVDVEPDEGIEADVIASIATAGELGWLDRLSREDRGRAARALFCAKEALFKAQFPLTLAFLEFGDVELDLALSDDHGEFTVLRARRMDDTVRCLRGRIARAAGHVFAGVAVRR